MPTRDFSLLTFIFATKNFVDHSTKLSTSELWSGIECLHPNVEWDDGTHFRAASKGGSCRLRLVSSLPFAH